MRNFFSELNAENGKLQSYDDFLNNISHYSPFFQNSDETAELFKTAKTFSFSIFFISSPTPIFRIIEQKKQNNIHRRRHKKIQISTDRKKNIKILEHYHTIRIQEFCIIKQNIKN